MSNDSNATIGMNRLAMFVRLIKTLGRVSTRFFFVFPFNWEHKEKLQRGFPNDKTPRPQDTQWLVIDDDYSRVGAMLWHLSQDETDVQRNFERVGVILDRLAAYTFESPESTDIFEFQLFEAGFSEMICEALCGIMEERLGNPSNTMITALEDFEPQDTSKPERISPMGKFWLVQHNIRQWTKKDWWYTTYLDRLRMLCVVDRLRDMMDTMARMLHKLRLMGQEYTHPGLPRVMQELEKFITNDFSKVLWGSRLTEFRDDGTRAEIVWDTSLLMSDRGTWTNVSNSLRKLNNELKRELKD